MNWQISKIEVSSFKAFKHIYLDLGESSLLTLDGPNGYGKTSIFDAIELLLTGRISRIQNLFDTLLTSNKNSSFGVRFCTIFLVEGSPQLDFRRNLPASDLFGLVTHSRFLLSLSK
jgi:energy-coupling factor transporter ATP-binding protein EcfA2